MMKNDNKARTNKIIYTSFFVLMAIGASATISVVLWYFCMRYDVPFRLEGHFEKQVYLTDRPFTVSPDGTKIVYSSRETGHGDLYAIDVNGKNVKRLTSTADYEAAPCFSLDGKWILYCRETSKCGHIWRMKPDGSNATQLTFGSDYDTNPMFAGDGDQVWFQRTPWGTGVGHYTIYTMTAEGKDVRSPVSGDAKMEDAVLCRQNNSIYYTQSNEIWQRSTNSTTDHRLADGEDPTVSPKGDWIAFVSAPWSMGIWIMRPDGSKQRQVYQSKGNKHFVTFSPDSARLFFLEESDQGLAISSISLNGSDYHHIYKL